MRLLERFIEDHVAIVRMNSGENRFNPVFIGAFLEILDHLEKNTEATALVVTSSDSKIFSNGIDLDWLVPVIMDNEIDKAKEFFFLLNDLFKKVLTYPMLTVASMNGHAYAGGAILSCAFDFRFMRSDRGYFCFPEVDLGIPFLPGMNCLLKKAMPMYMVEEMEYTGINLTAKECEEHHIIKKACHNDDLMDECLKFSKALNKKRDVIRELKQRLYKDIIRAFEVEDVPYIESGKFNIG